MADVYDTGINGEAFEQALTLHHYSEAKKILSKININAKDEEGKTYVIKACLSNDLERLKWLSQNGGETNVYNKYGKHLIFLVIEAGNSDIVKWLVKDNPNYIEKTFKNHTTLHSAVINNRIDIVKVLVKAGADYDIQNGDGKTAIDIAYEKQYREILKWLLTHKSFEILKQNTYEEGKVNELKTHFGKYGYEYLNGKRDEDNTTIAEYAASTQQIEILKWLKAKNIQVDESLLVHDDQITPKQTYNLLLVGETGVGKSTFINAFMNYLTFSSLEEAEEADNIHSLIPSNFTVTDDNFQPKLIRFGSDQNESIIPGASATQSARSYLFQAGNITIRLIDTPGIGDTRGINKDEENFDRLLTVVGELEYLHGICILLKPNNAKLTVLFEYCIKQLLSRLQKDASQNIIFLFTNSRSTFYRPGDTMVPLQVILEEIKSKPPYIEIPFNKKNIFCLDNEAFRFLIAKRNNIEFDEDEKENFSKSWTKSANVSIKMLKHMTTLKPHKIQETVSLNEARRLILRLSIPLAEMAQHINDNIQRAERYKERLSDKSKTIDELKKYLMVPRIGLEVVNLDYPMTVCTNRNCTETVKIEDSTKVNYKQVCHEHCYLEGVKKEVIGDIELRYCWAMISKDKTKKCKHATCGHSYLEHMHIYYKTTPYNYTEEDQNVALHINQNKVDIKDIEKKIDELSQRSQQYTDERETIQKSMAKFAHFLKNNAITPFNDTYRKYIEYLIDREKKMDDGGDRKRLDAYEQLLATYENYKAILEAELTKVQKSDPNYKAVVSAQEVVKIVEGLYKLPHSGATIKNMYLAQKNVVSGELLRNTEKTVRPKPVKGQSLKDWICRKFSFLC